MKKTLILFSFLFCQNIFAKKIHRIDTSKSVIKWVGHKGIPSLIKYSHSGTIAIKSGSVSFDKEKLISASLVIDMNSIENTDLSSLSRKQKLVGHLKTNDFFAVAQYPEASFNSTRIDESTAKNKYNITGLLKIKDRTHPEMIALEVKKEKGGYFAKGNLRIDRTRYNVTYLAKKTSQWKEIFDANILEKFSNKLILDHFDLEFILYTKTS